MSRSPLEVTALKIQYKCFDIWAGHVATGYLVFKWKASNKTVVKHKRMRNSEYFWDVIRMKPSTAYV